MQQTSDHFLDNASEALANKKQAESRDIMALFTPLIRDAAVQAFEPFETLRAHVKRVRQHSLDNLGHYLETFEKQALANGNQRSHGMWVA